MERESGGAMIALYHCAHDDVNWCKQRDKKIDTTSGGEKNKKTMACNYMDCVTFFTGLLKYNVPMTDHKFCVKPLRYVYATRIYTICDPSSACYTPVNP